ncbi:MAG TPA: hypothetical protein PLE77_09075 [Kiritimatiellia bacterium]|nr:hypothetical protein [Kiritimatiellia bacterium]
MANLNAELQKYHDSILLADWKEESLRRARDAIREKIRKYFRDTLKVAIPVFRQQGSFAAGTTVTPLDGEFDVDDGVYLQHLSQSDDRDWPTPETVHRWLVEATDGHTEEKPVDKRTCVRLRYAGEYHVDLPAYATLNGECRLAEKGDAGWHPSDPIAFNDWFAGLVKQHGDQLKRLVRYLKAWADYQAGKRGSMPGGILLTVLASQNFRPNSRDDVALAETAKAISTIVAGVFRVYNPVDGREELTARLSDEQKTRFKEAIADLASHAAEAVALADRKKASELWRTELGDRFPLVSDEDKDDESRQAEEDAKRLATFYVPKKPVKPWADV